MRFLLDTDTCVFWLRGHIPVRDRLSAVGPEAVAVSVITLAELRYGAHCPPPDFGLRDLTASPCLLIRVHLCSIYPLTGPHPKSTSSRKYSLPRERPAGGGPMCSRTGNLQVAHPREMCYNPSTLETTINSLAVYPDRNRGCSVRQQDGRFARDALSLSLCGWRS